MIKTFLLTLLFTVAVSEAKQHKKKDVFLKGPQHWKGWLHIKEVSGCKCAAHEICIAGPATSSKPICVNKHFLHEGQKLFRQFHKHKIEEEKYLRGKRPLPHERPLHDSPEHIGVPHNLRIRVHAKHNFHNDVKPKDEIASSWRYHSSLKKHHPKTCSMKDLNEMRERLTGWFRLLHAVDHHRHPSRRLKHHHKHLSVKKELRHQHHHEGKCKCLKSVMWEMHHLDTNKDHHLSQHELAVIENNGREPCLKPFLLTCDHNHDNKLSRNEWCCCYAEVLPPCFQKMREVQLLLKTNSDVVVPRCDKEGYFEKEQCSGDSFDTRVCWCVDLNGNEIPNTKARVKANCRKIDLLGHKKN